MLLRVCIITLTNNAFGSTRHLLALINSVALVCCCAKMCGLCERLTLMELVKMGRILIDRLRAFLARNI